MGRMDDAAAAALTRDLLEDLLPGDEPRDLAVRLWEDSTLGPEPGRDARFTIVLAHPGALKAMFVPPTELALGEAFVHGDFDVEGDLEGVFGLADRLLGRERGVLERARLAARLLALPVPPRERAAAAAGPRGPLHSPERDREAVTYHYDRSADFFAAFLDRRLVYSCAYFEDARDDLDTAQERKLDLLCQKLRLRPGERLLDVGCGFGALALHATERYGADVLGITLSEPQAEVARERVAAAGLGERCRIEVRDYRELDGRETFDKIVSVGMFEHVGEALLPEYFGIAHRLLRPRGVFLNHGIARVGAAARTSEFVRRYVFPDGELVPAHVTLEAAEEAGFELRDVEGLREHYALTLRHWVTRLEGSRDAAVAAEDELAYRVWRLYMAGSAHAFATGRLSVFQALLAKPADGDAGLPLTRADWY